MQQARICRYGAGHLAAAMFWQTQICAYWAATNLTPVHILKSRRQLHSHAVGYRLPLASLHWCLPCSKNISFSPPHLCVCGTDVALVCPVSVSNAGNVRLLNISLQGSTMGSAGVVAGPDVCEVTELAPLHNTMSCNVSFTLAVADFAAGQAQLLVVANASTVFPAIIAQNSTVASYGLQYARTLSVTLMPTLQPDSKFPAWLCLSCWCWHLIMLHQAALSCLKNTLGDFAWRSVSASMMVLWQDIDL